VNDCTGDRSICPLCAVHEPVPDIMRDLGKHFTAAA
jgi:hypothetical protein